MKKVFFVISMFRRLIGGFNSPGDPKVISLQIDSLRKDTCSVGNTDAIVPLVNEIIRMLEEQKIYRSPHLDLRVLSEKLRSPAYLVTRAINEGLGVNYHDLINRYRVEEVKSLLKADCCKRFTLLSVAFDAGFSSKTTFNTVFKKMTGYTPSSYRARHCSTNMEESSIRSLRPGSKVYNLET